jgi:hypothetical protein
VIADTQPLFQEFSKYAKNPGEFKITVPSGGQWVGDVLHYEEKPILNVRTFTANAPSGFPLGSVARLT